MFSAQIYSERRMKLRNNIKSGLVVLLGNSESSMNYPSNTYHFRQDSSFLYYFGLDQPDYVGVIDIDNGNECIYANDYTIDDIVWMGKLPSVSELASTVGVSSSYPTDELHRAISSAIRSGRKVHFLPPYRLSNTVKLCKLLGLQAENVKDYVSGELVKAVIAQREIKSFEEIEQIDHACDIAHKMHTTAMRMCRVGQLERKIMGTLEGISLQDGSGVSFPPIITINGQTLHNHNYSNTLKDGRLLLVDSGAENTMRYCSDYTRTMPVNGKFSQKQKEIYDIVLAANLHTCNTVKAGMTYKEAHLNALRIIGDGLHALGLIKGDVEQAVLAGAIAMFMPHGLGHQMGLDVHDMEDLGERLVGYDAKTERATQFGLAALRMGKELRKGHVITVEPGIYFIPDLIAKWKNEKINSEFINFQKVESYLDFGGIRIEDDLLIEEGCARKMGHHHTPVTTAEVEAEIAKGV